MNVIQITWFLFFLHSLRVFSLNIKRYQKNVSRAKKSFFFPSFEKSFIQRMIPHSIFSFFILQKFQNSAQIFFLPFNDTALPLQKSRNFSKIKLLNHFKHQKGKKKYIRYKKVRKTYKSQKKKHWIPMLLKTSKNFLFIKWKCALEVSSRYQI